MGARHGMAVVKRNDKSSYSGSNRRITLLQFVSLCLDPRGTATRSLTSE
jgi:hypothetical protein